MKQVTKYIAKDGTEFFDEMECQRYEQKLDKDFAAMGVIFFDMWGSVVDIPQYNNMKVDYIYIPKESYEMAKKMLKIHNRSLKGYSESNIYVSYCMCYQPIEERLAKNMKRVEQAQEEYDRNQQRLQKMLKKVENRG
jgi:hypothetical protein